MFALIEGDVVLYDADGNPLVLNGGDTVGATAGVIMAGAKDVDGNAAVLELAADGALRVNPSLGGNVGNRVFAALEDSGGDVNLYVDGSTTSVPYSYDADASDDIYITQIRFVINATDIQFKEGSGDGTFHKLNALTNGLLLQVRSESTTYDLANFKRDEEFLAFGGNDVFDKAGTSDLLTASYKTSGIKLVAGSADFVKVTVRDDLENAGHIFFACYVMGYKV